MDHAGLGPYQVSNFLTALNLPSIHPSTLRARENEIGSTLKTYTKESCGEALLSEASATSYVLSDFLFRLVLRFDYEIDTLI